MSEKLLDELLQQCTVRLNSDGRQGSGFFVAPRLILTCAHVVEGASDVIDVFWASHNQHYTAQIENLISDPNLDLALLKLSCDGLEHPCVYFDQSVPRLNDSLYIFGYPLDYAENYSDGDSVTIKYEGKSFKGSALLLKLKEGQIKEGFSGSPLLNLRTGGVCGIVNISRNTNTDLGGRAVPTAQIFEHAIDLTESNRRFHQRDLRWKKLLPQPLNQTNLKPRDVKNRYRLVSAVKTNIERWLDASLPYKQTKINLSKEMQPKLVRRPGDDKFRTLSKPSSLLSLDTNIVEVFQQESVSGRLLILGEPGAGKTVALLELAKYLVACAETDINEPIPILFNLSSWKNQKIEDWMVAELESSGYGVSNKAAWNLLKEHKIIPLLDGLDDLKPTEQSKCVSAINKFLSGSSQTKYLVVCSRLTEYVRCFPQLELNNAVCLVPLNENQIEEYLSSIKCLELWQSIESDPNLLELAKTPLFLFMLTVAYEKTSPKAWQVLTSEKQRYRYLFDSYIEQILEDASRKRSWFSKNPKPEKTKSWLIYIAKRLKADFQKEFIIEKIQPSWLQSRKQKAMYRIIAGVTAGLTGSLAFVPFGLPLFSPLLSVLFILFIPQFLIIAPWATLVNGLTAGIKSEIKPIETLKFSSKNLFRNIKIKHLITWSLYALLGYFLSLVFGSFIPIMSVLLIGFFLSRFQDSLTNNLHGPDIEPDKRSIPNQGIRRSAFNAWILSLVFGLIGGLIGGILFFEKCSTLSTEKFPIFLIGEIGFFIEVISRFLGICPTTLLAIIFFASLGMMGGSLLPGTACVQHFALRLILWWNGYTPWNYARFLNYATDKGFLKRVGGRYRFIHDLLQEHFAQMEDDPKNI